MVLCGGSEGILVECKIVGVDLGTWSTVSEGESQRVCRGSGGQQVRQSVERAPPGANGTRARVASCCGRKLVNREEATNSAVQLGGSGSFQGSRARRRTPEVHTLPHRKSSCERHSAHRVRRGFPSSLQAKARSAEMLRWGGRSRSLCRVARPRSGGSHVPLREGPEVRRALGSKSPCVVWIGRRRCFRWQAAGPCAGRQETLLLAAGATVPLRMAGDVAAVVTGTHASCGSAGDVAVGSRSCAGGQETQFRAAGAPLRRRCCCGRRRRCCGWQTHAPGMCRRRRSGRQAPLCRAAGPHCCGWQVPSR